MMAPTSDIFGRPGRVLIVDDERPNRQLMEVMLAPEGYLLWTASSGEEALAIVAQQPPDLVLLDVMMPGMDGYQVASLIKGNPATKSIPVIMVTALDDRDARMRGLRAGAEDYLTKPVDRAEMCVRVRNLLRLKAYSDYHDKYSQMLEDEVGSRTVDLVQSESLYRSTFDASPVGIVHVGLDGKWLRVNQRLCELLGYSRDELQGGAVQKLLQSEDTADEADALRRMFAGTLERHVIDEKRYRRRDGSFMWARVNISVHRDAGRQPQLFISVIEDITERRALDSRLRQTNKMDAIGQLASGVAHDFNNLLTVILGFSALIADDTATTVQHKEDLAEVMSAARRATGLTRQLLAFSRQQVMNTTHVDVNELITDMTGMLGRLIGEHVEITPVLAPRLSGVIADRGQLEQVVMNLVVNARDAMPGGGRLTIETAEVDIEDSVSPQQNVVRGPHVMISVADTGTGMSADTQRHLFEPFFTTKEIGEGTGLGLSTVYGIVKQSKGHISVSSELGRGTTFRVYLPRAEPDVPLQAPCAEVTAPARKCSETILLVEDEAGVRQLSKRLLDDAGYRVLVASDGNAAEKLFDRHAESIDLLVTDVIMPRCGGPELVSRLEVRRPGLKVLYMSGYSEKFPARDAPGDRRHRVVQKPFTPAEFVRQVRDALAR
jgi:two-component system cell cycle sensor histidine kinase/response regulator CckA